MMPKERATGYRVGDGAFFRTNIEHDVQSPIPGDEGMMLTSRQWITDGGVTVGLCLALYCVFAMEVRDGDVRLASSQETAPAPASLIQAAPPGPEVKPAVDPVPQQIPPVKRVPNQDSQQNQPPESPPELPKMAARETPTELTTKPPVEIAVIAPPEPPPTIYSARTDSERVKLATLRGGSPESEQAVTRGLDWLARHQGKDGSWGKDYLGQNSRSVCEQDDRCGDPGIDAYRAHTGLALLAFLASGHYHNNDREYSSVVARGLDWLVATQGTDGKLAGKFKLPEGFLEGLAELNVQGFEDLIPEGFSAYYMYEHGIATLALAEACAVDVAEGREPNPDFLAATEKAVAFIEKNQHSDGGWRYSPTPSEASDTSVSGWQILALKTAMSAGIEVKPAIIDKLHGFMDRCLLPDGQTMYVVGGPRHGTIATTGVGMLFRQFLLNDGNSSHVKQAGDYLASQVDRIPNSRTARPDYYGWYNGSLAMFRAGGENWERWNEKIRDQLIIRQMSDGCERGSWDPNDGWGPTGGRIYSTALAILTLEVYYRFDREAELENDEARQTRTAENFEQRAAAKMRLAERFFELGQRPNGVRWLKEIVTEFPETESAQQARAKLTDLGVPFDDPASEDDDADVMDTDTADETGDTDEVDEE